MSDSDKDKQGFVIDSVVESTSLPSGTSLWSSISSDSASAGGVGEDGEIDISDEDMKQFIRNFSGISKSIADIQENLQNLVSSLIEFADRNEEQMQHLISVIKHKN